MITPQRTLLTKLKNLFPRDIWEWLIPALRQDEQIWHTLQKEDFQAGVIQSVGENAQAWTPARLGTVALNQELPSLLKWPPNQLLPDVQQMAAHAYRDYVQNPSAAMSLAKAQLLALALRENYRATPSWKEVLTSCQPLEAWKTPLACLYTLIDSRHELLSAIPVPLGIHALSATPMPREKAQKELLEFLSLLAVEKQVDWLRAFSASKPKLVSEVAHTLASVKNPRNPHTAELSQRAELYRLAQCPQEALEILHQATEKQKFEQAQLSAQTNTITAQLREDPLRSVTWKEVVAAARTPSGVREHVADIVLLLDTLVEKERLTAAENLVENIAAPYPQHPALLTSIANLALVQGRREDAQKLAQQALESLSENSSAPPALSEILLRLGLYEDSVKAAQHTLATHPNHWETLSTLAKAQNALEHYAEATESASLAATLAPDQLDLRRNFAHYLENAQDWDSALEEWEQIVKTLEDKNSSTSTAKSSPPVDDQLSQAGCALKAGKADTAAQICQKILHISPKKGEAHIILGKSLSALGNPKQAVEHLKQATELAPHLAVSWLALAEIQLENGESVRAIRTLSAGVNSAAQGAEIQLALGKIHHARDEHALALSAFEKAVELSESEGASADVQSQAYLELGKSLHRLGRLEDARRTLKGLVKRSPKNMSAALVYGKVLLELGAARNALPYLKKVVDANPSEAEAYIAYAQAHLNIGINFEAAIEALRQALDCKATHEQQGLALVLQGEAFTAVGDSASALDAYRAAMENSAHLAPVWEKRAKLGMGKAALAAGETEIALATLQDCYQSDVHNLDAAHALARAYHHANLNSKAQEILREAFELAPNDLDNLSLTADFALELGAGAIAIPVLQNIIQLAPQRASAYLQLGQTQSLNGDTKQAAQTFSQLCTLENPSAEALLQAGEELSNLGEVQKAITCLERSVQICESNPANKNLLPQTQSLLAACYQAKGDSAQALATLDKAIIAQLNNPKWRLQKVELLTSLGRHQAALASLHNALEQSPQNPDLHYKAALLYRQIGDGATALEHALESERGYLSLGEDAALNRNHALALSANLAWFQLQESRARVILSEGIDSILETLTDTQYQLLDGACLYAELLLANNQEIEAAQILTELLSITTHPPRVKALQARLTSRQGNFGESQHIFEEAIEAHKKQKSENVSISSCLALGQAAQELQNWNQAIELFSQGVEIAPTENIARLHLGRALVRRAEIHRLSEDLRVLRNTPGSESISASTRKLFKTLLCSKDEVASSNPQFRKWRVRGEAVFTPSAETAAALGELPPEEENLAAQIAALRYSHAPRKALHLAQNCFSAIKENSILAVQTALALMPADAQKAHQAAQMTFNGQSTLESPLLYALEAITAQNKGDFKASHQAIQTALSSWENEPRWQALAGEVAPSPQEAIPHFEEAVRLESTYAGHHLALGKAYLEAGQIEAAISTLRQSTRLDSSQTQAWIVLTLAYKRVPDLEKATNCARQALKHSPENVIAQKQLATLALEREDYSEAEKYLTLLLKRQPQDVELLELLAQSLSAQNRPKQAVEALSKAIALHKQPLALQLKRATLLHQTEGLSASLNALRDLAEEHPQRHEVLFPLAEAWAEAGEHKMAIQTAQQALNSNHGGTTLAEKAELHLFMGRLLRQTGQLDQAVHHLHQALKLAPQSGEAYIELGQAEQKRRQYDKAIKALNQAIKHSPQELRGYYHAGLVLKELNDYAQAERMLRQAAKLAPNDLRIRRQLGVLATLNLVHG